MARACYCANCDRTYTPAGLKGLMFCDQCGAKVAHVFSETLTDAGHEHTGPMVETPMPTAIPVESVIEPEPNLIVETVKPTK